MKKTITGVIIAAALTLPGAAFADDGQLIGLYQKLVMILQQELAMLKTASVTIDPKSGVAPFQTTFTLVDPIGSEAIDFGDGHSTGSNGCAKNSKGFCDLSLTVPHTYIFPGTYTVKIYRGKDPNAVVVGTDKVVVTVK